MESKVLKVAAALGVPGLALGVFYLLLKQFKFEFAMIPPTLAGIIVILFLLIVGGITLFALDRFKPPPPPPRPVLRWDAHAREVFLSKMSEWAECVYNVTSGHRYAMQHDAAWPGTQAEIDLVHRESTLYSQIVASLDVNRAVEKQLAEDIKVFREDDDFGSWSTRRDLLMAKMQPALTASP